MSLERLKGRRVSGQQISTGLKGSTPLELDLGLNVLVGELRWRVRVWTWYRPLHDCAASQFAEQFRDSQADARLPGWRGRVSSERSTRCEFLRAGPIFPLAFELGEVWVGSVSKQYEYLPRMGW